MNKHGHPRRMPSRRRELEIARTREDILVAAARALGRSGLHAMSMQEIAEDVGFTAPALYAYFESKEEIIRELVRCLGRELAETFEPPPPAALPFREKLALLLSRQLEWADRRREVFAAFFAMKMRGEQVMKPHERPENLGPLGYLAQLTEWVKRAAAGADDLGGSDPSEAACVLMGVSHAYFLRSVCGKRQQRLADQRDRILDVFFHGVSGQRSGRGKRQTAAAPGPTSTSPSTSSSRRPA